MTTTTTKPVRFGFNTNGHVIHIPSDGSRNVTLIAAVDRKLGIGKNNDIPWKLSEDLKHFKRLTDGHAIIMGRKTQESLPGKGYLPGRTNIVVSASGNVKHPLVQVAESLEEAIDLVSNRQIFIIGGASIYEQALKFADDMILTLIDGDYDCDRFFPTFDNGEWEAPSYSSHTSVKDGHTLNYRFAYYRRSTLVGDKENECVSGSTGS